MRPERFQDFAIDALKSTPGTTQAQTLQDAGETKYPFGFTVTTGDGEARWQIMGQLAEGERHDHQERPVEGSPAAWSDVTPGSNAEGWVAAAIGKAESPEIARIDRWSVRDGGNQQGMTIFFHNGARAFVRKI